MDDEIYEIVIIGSGPAGLSAAAHAKKLGVSHILLEAKNHLADTIQKYQKGKNVMAEPSKLPLRSDMTFVAGFRENVLDTWQSEIEKLEINIQLNKQVKSIEKINSTEEFHITCEDSSYYRSKFVILAIGLQGNIRKLGVDGENLDRVQYTLSDPDEYQNETIVVIGAGDAGIENALGLMKKNNVFLVNRQAEFTTCKDGNRDLILNAEKSGQLNICYLANTVKVEETGSTPPLRYTYNGKEGISSILCHRVIARLGAIPPRKQVESFGIVFPNKNPESIPIVSEKYESNVPNLYIVGALGGYPLIKQAMNQGFEVVESILGRNIEPADENLLKEKIVFWKKEKTVSEVLEILHNTLELFKSLSKLQMRELLFDSTISLPKPNVPIFKKLDYTNSVFSIIEGSVSIQLEESNKIIQLTKGEFFGEMGLISGRRRNATVLAGKDCVILETPRNSMLKLISLVDDLRTKIDNRFIKNFISANIGPKLENDVISELMLSGIEKRKFQTNEIIFSEGDDADGLYFVRSGSLTVSKLVNDKEIILAYISAGNYVGEMALLNNIKRTATIRATILSEVLILKSEAFLNQINKNPEWKHSIQQEMLKRIESNIETEEVNSNDSDIKRFLLKQGLGEASDVLIINESLCIQCNNCETACAETHNGTSRLKRDAGPSYSNIHIPIACRHCENPSCMKDCPPDAIRRNKEGEVSISEACIGCGNCEKNCPYGVIQMAYETPIKNTKINLNAHKVDNNRKKPPKSTFIKNVIWLMTGIGQTPGQRKPNYSENAIKKAVKCDLCANLSGGPSCVRSCPTGAAIRISPEKILNSNKEVN